MGADHLGPISKTRNTFCGTRYLSHCPTIIVTFNPHYWKFYSVCWFPNKPPILNYKTSDITGHMIIGFAIYGFLYLVNLKQPFTLHSCQDMVLIRFCGHDVDLLASRNVNCKFFLPYCHLWPSFGVNPFEFLEFLLNFWMNYLRPILESLVHPLVNILCS